MSFRDRVASRRRPLLLCDSASGEVLARCARSSRVAIGSALHTALASVPDAVVLPYDAEAVAAAFDEITVTLRALSDRIEPVWAADHLWVYLDLGRVSPDVAKRLVRAARREVGRALGIKPLVGAAEHRFTAFAAAWTTKSTKVIRPDNDAGFLFRLPLDDLPLSRESRRRLALLGVETLGAFAALPRYAVRAQFGAEALLAHEMARGADPRPVVPVIPQHTETVRWDFDDPVVRRERLEAALYPCVAPAFDRLDRAGAVLESLTLCLTLANGASVEATREPRVRNLADLRRAIALALDNTRIDAPVSGLRVTLRGTQLPAPVQLSLFPDELAAAPDLRLVADRLDARGTACLEAVLTDRDAPLPEHRFAFRRIS